MSFLLLNVVTGQQRYTLLVTDPETKQTNIASFNGSPILTSYHDELVGYTAQLAGLFPRKIYSIATLAEDEYSNRLVKMAVEQSKGT